jgi:hypothetical protein
LNIHKLKPVVLLTLLLAVTTVGNSTARAAKRQSVASKAKISRLIKQSPDLKPTGKILRQNHRTYLKREDMISKNYNLENFADSGVFNHKHQARIYVVSPVLKSYVRTAVKRWNTALGRQVFKVTTKRSRGTLRVSLKTSDAQWDGLFDGNRIYVNRADFNTPNTARYLEDSQYQAYIQHMTALQNEAAKKVQKLAADHAVRHETLEDSRAGKNGDEQGAIQAEADAEMTQYFQSERQIQDSYQAKLKAYRQSKHTWLVKLKVRYQRMYWNSVVEHELGHGLGLDHTPYLADVMFAASNDEGEYKSLNVKYPWVKDIAVATRDKLSARDIDRAKLARKLNYW